jgi:hypothetical protein
MGLKKKIKIISIRLALISFGILLLLEGMGALLHGDWSYQPVYWGGPMFGGAAVLVAILVIYASTFRWPDLERPVAGKKKKTVRFPGDEI